MPPEICGLRLARWLGQIKRTFDVVIIDCPPSISSLSLAALKASDGVLVPMKAEYFSLSGLPYLLNSIDRYDKLLNLSLKVAGVLLTMVPADKTASVKTNLYATQVAKLCKQEKVPFLTSRVSENPAYPQSYDNHEPIAFSGNTDYGALVNELESVLREIHLLPASAK